MGAALHLAHLHQTPPAQYDRTKGNGGGGDGYDQFVARVWQDKRMTPEARELLLLAAWLTFRDPKRGEDNWRFWGRATEILGADGHAGRRQRPRLAVLLDADAPQYEPDWQAPEWRDDSCQAPMIRRAGLCGQPSSTHAARVDPATGWEVPVWYCSRHREFGRQVQAAYKTAHKPEPIPNRGGLLPSYLRHRAGDGGWVKLYGWASKWCHSGWKPQVGYGLAADECSPRSNCQ